MVIVCFFNSLLYFQHYMLKKSKTTLLCYDVWPSLDFSLQRKGIRVENQSESYFAMFWSPFHLSLGHGEIDDGQCFQQSYRLFVTLPYLSFCLLLYQQTRRLYQLFATTIYHSQPTLLTNLHTRHLLVWQLIDWNMKNFVTSWDIGFQLILAPLFQIQQP